MLHFQLIMLSPAEAMTGLWPAARTQVSHVKSRGRDALELPDVQHINVVICGARTNRRRCCGAGHASGEASRGRARHCHRIPVTVLSPPAVGVIIAPSPRCWLHSRSGQREGPGMWPGLSGSVRTAPRQASAAAAARRRPSVSWTAIQSSASSNSPCGPSTGSARDRILEQPGKPDILSKQADRPTTRC